MIGKRVVILIIIAMSFLTACSKDVNPYVPKEAGSELELWVASDLHYLDPSLTAPGPVFDQTYIDGDGKQTQNIDSIVDALIYNTDVKKPDALILSGDLTFNGEKASHEGLAKKLETLRKTGIPVLVIPGNHDINNFYAYSYGKDRIRPTEQVSPENFEKIYGHFGYEAALSKDPKSLSYIFKLSEDLRIIMLDSCIYENNSRLNPSTAGGRIRPETMEWLENQLKIAQDEGAQCISVTHHNLLIHNSAFFSTFTIENSNALVELYKQYDVAMNLSGHMHIQHIETAELKDFKIADIATGALSVRGNAVGHIQYKPHKSLSYQRHSLDVEGYAKANGLTDANLLSFVEYSRQFFFELSYKRTFERMVKNQVPPADASAMASVLTELNLAYFEGSLSTYVPQLRNAEGFKLLENSSDLFNKSYFNTMISETGEHQQIVMPLD